MLLFHKQAQMRWIVLIQGQPLEGAARPDHGTISHPSDLASFVQLPQCNSLVEVSAKISRRADRNASAGASDTPPLACKGCCKHNKTCGSTADCPIHSQSFLLHIALACVSMKACMSLIFLMGRVNGRRQKAPCNRLPSYLCSLILSVLEQVVQTTAESPLYLPRHNCLLCVCACSKSAAASEKIKLLCKNSHKGVIRSSKHTLGSRDKNGV